MRVGSAQLAFPADKANSPLPFPDSGMLLRGIRYSVDIQKLIATLFPS